MNLDARISDEGKIFNMFGSSAEKARQYIEHPGYFASDLWAMSDLDYCDEGILGAVDADNSLGPYYHRLKGQFYAFFIPACYLYPKAKEKFIPFRYLNELTDAGIDVGKVISIRHKNDDIVVAKVLVTEINYNHETNEVIDITLGATGYEFSTLFNSYRFQVNGEWAPFGVVEE